MQTTRDNQQRFLAKMKVYMTEEIRVRKTAKEFTRCLLNKSRDQSADIEPYLIEGKEVQKMLDDVSSVKQLIQTAKQEIQHIFCNAALRESLLDDHYLPPTPRNPEYSKAFRWYEDDNNNNNNVSVSARSSSNHLHLGLSDCSHANDIEREL